MSENIPRLSRTEPFVDRFRRLTSRWYPVMQRLVDTLRTVQDSVTTVTQTIDQQAQSWSVSINSDQHVLGLVTLDAATAITEFTVVADKFVIANPADGTDTREFFIAGEVNGVDTVGIAGDLIVDGTVLARHLGVSTLSAISADVGTVTAGVIKSADDKMIINLNNGTINITA